MIGNSLIKIAALSRGGGGRDGRTGRRGSAAAYGEFSSIVCTGDLLYIKDGNVLREMDMRRQTIDTICGETSAYLGGSDIRHTSLSRRIGVAGYDTREEVGGYK